MKCPLWIMFCGVVAFLIAASQQLDADVIVLQSAERQSGNSETGQNLRAVYLGRLFEGLSVQSGIPRFTGISSAVVVRNAVNVQLWAGNGSSQFETNIGNFVDTGARFNQVTGDFLPAFAPNPFVGTQALAPQVGQGLLTTFRSVGHLDFWLVGNRLDTFSAPSSSNPGSGNSTPFQYYVGFSAVPEPSSMLLCGLGLSGLYAWRRRRSAKKIMA